ncbi:hypothetical protein CLV80_101139 [Yoonia maritima]|uniref:Uncharacterized protein n=1 Tax=Yoonia maritima TaxID=1435347 RepID=A0A2T0W488_9RHOB|nr:hypothetical protein [Yoonia maritima]PRY80288.1 hypothetical protein CLV80_101139 [Yoonia maritima]
MLDFTKKPRRSRGGFSFFFGVGIAFAAMLAVIFAMGQASAQAAPHGPAPIYPITVSTLDGTPVSSGAGTF